MVLAPLPEKGPARWLALLLNTVASVTLLSLMIITCIDVFGRYVFNRPLTGSTELVEMSLALMVFAVLPVISWRNEHIVVDLLDSFTPPTVHMVRNVLLNIVTAAALYFLGERILTLGSRSLNYGEESEYLGIPLGWAINFMGAMCWLTAVALLTLGIHRAIKRHRQHKSPETNLYR